MTWIYRNWAQIGGLAACGIILFVLISGMELTDMGVLLWLHFAGLLLHQFEEYVYPGGFKDFYNRDIRNINALAKSTLNDRGIILVNILFGWTAYLLSAISGVKMLWLAIGLSGITISNGMLHTVMFLRKRRYIPGMVSGLFLFIPFGIYVLLKAISVGTAEDLISGMVVFVIGTVSIPVSIYITYKIGLPDNGSKKSRTIRN
jgi:hypothetical protein